MRGYVLVFSPAVADQEAMQTFIDSQPENGYWISPFGHCILLTSSLSPTELRDRIDHHFSLEHGMYLIVQASAGRIEGRLPFRGWNTLLLPNEVNQDELFRKDPTEEEVKEIARRVTAAKATKVAKRRK